MNASANNPTAREASRKVANLTERKNLHTPVHGVTEYTQKTKSHFKKGWQDWLPELFLSACFHPL